MKKKIKIILLLVIVLGALFLWRDYNTRSSAAKSLPTSRKAAVQKVIVRAMAVKKQDLNLMLFYVGSLKAKDEINVYSKVTGKLAEYTVNDGDYVEKGQTIALVDRDEIGFKFELAKVESPISGIVGKTLLDKGTNILTGGAGGQGTSLAIIVQMDEMIVKLNVEETAIPYFKKGLNAKVKEDAYPDENFEGAVSKVSEVVDTQTRTLPVEITIPNKDHRLKSGMFGRIAINAGLHKDVLVIKQDALIEELGASYVFVVNDHTAVKQKVTLGIRDNGMIEILEGLKEGDRIIVFGQQGLKDGASVETAEGDN